MNGYQFQADAYRKYLEQNPNEENKEYMERIIKVNEFLATCTKEDIEELYNTSAFNEIKWLHDTIGAGMIANN